MSEKGRSDMSEHKKWKFQNVRQEEDSSGDIQIFFSLGEESFMLRIYQPTDSETKRSFGPVSHQMEWDGKPCNICGKSRIRGFCKELSRLSTREELFQALIDEPTIRLNWIFLEHPTLD